MPKSFFLSKGRFFLKLLEQFVNPDVLWQIDVSFLLEFEDVSGTKRPLPG
jgi:hypothetical protein